MEEGEGLFAFLSCFNTGKDKEEDETSINMKDTMGMIEAGGTQKDMIKDAKEMAVNPETPFFEVDDPYQDTETFVEGYQEKLEEYKKNGGSLEGNKDNPQKVEIVNGDDSFEDYDFFVDREENEFDTEPQDWNEYIGQKEIKTQIKRTISGVKKHEKAPYPHIIVSGNAGYGKSCLIHLLAKKSNFPLIETVAGNLQEKEDIYELLDQLPKEFPYGIIFIDEIHGLKKEIGEILLPVAQTFKVNNRPIPYFTLAGATTELGTLSEKLSPLVDRCKQNFKLKPYTDEQLATIIKNQAEKRDLKFTYKALLEVASRSRETPRKALSFLDNLMYYAWYEDLSKIERKDVKQELKNLGVYENGITEQDINLLEYLNRQEKPVGQNALTQVLNVPKKTYSNEVEPFLVRKEMIIRTPRGRVMGEAGEEYLKQLKEN